MTDRGSSLATCAHQARLNVAIDGPAGAGKSTVGRRLALLLEVPLLDTGLMYREVTARGLAARADPADEVAMADIASSTDFGLDNRPDESALTSDGSAIDPSTLHCPDVDRVVSIVAAHARVRTVLVQRQRLLAQGKAIVMLGRDIGTVVLLDAPAKIFLTASSKVRSERRLSERQIGGRQDPSVGRDLTLRDRRDEGRAVSPLRPAEDATVIDTSGLTVEETVDEALRLSILPALDRLLDELDT